MIQERIGGMSTRSAFVLICQVLFVVRVLDSPLLGFKWDWLGLSYLFLIVILHVSAINSTMTTLVEFCLN